MGGRKRLSWRGASSAVQAPLSYLQSSDSALPCKSKGLSTSGFKCQAAVGQQKASCSHHRHLQRAAPAAPGRRRLAHAVRMLWASRPQCSARHLVAMQCRGISDRRHAAPVWLHKAARRCAALPAVAFGRLWPARCLATRFQVVPQLMGGTNAYCQGGTALPQTCQVARPGRLCAVRGDEHGCMGLMSRCVTFAACNILVLRGVWLAPQCKQRCNVPDGLQIPPRCHTRCWHTCKERRRRQRRATDQGC